MACDVSPVAMFFSIRQCWGTPTPHLPDENFLPKIVHNMKNEDALSEVIKSWSFHCVSGRGLGGTMPLFKVEPKWKSFQRHFRQLPFASMDPQPNSYLEAIARPNLNIQNQSDI